MSKTLVIVIRLLPAIAEIATIFSLKYLGRDSFVALFCGIAAFFLLSPVVGIALIMISASGERRTAAQGGFRSAVRAYLAGLLHSRDDPPWRRTR
jgi:hypothetical protein